MTRPPDFAPSWSPDGRRIAFVSWREGNQDIYIFNLDTLDVINLTNTPARNEDYPAWSPDGRRLTFSAVEQGRELVLVQNVNNIGGSAELIGAGRTPAWSADGSSLAFAADSADGQTTYLSARPYNSDGGSDRSNCSPLWRDLADLVRCSLTTAIGECWWAESGF